MTGRFERDASEVGRARRFVRSSLRTWGLDAHTSVLELAVSELVSNALLHGDGAIEVGLRSENGQIRLEVTDEGRAADAPRPRENPGDDRRLGGWGLHVVEQLADRWGATSERERTRVWMVKRTEQPTARQDAGRGPA